MGLIGLLIPLIVLLQYTWCVWLSCRLLSSAGCSGAVQRCCWAAAAAAAACAAGATHAAGATRAGAASKTTHPPAPPSPLLTCNCCPLQRHLPGPVGERAAGREPAGPGQGGLGRQGPAGWARLQQPLLPLPPTLLLCLQLCSCACSCAAVRACASAQASASLCAYRRMAVWTRDKPACWSEVLPAWFEALPPPCCGHLQALFVGSLIAVIFLYVEVILVSALRCAGLRCAVLCCAGSCCDVNATVCGVP